MDNQRLIELTKNSKVSNSNKKEIAQLLTERFQEDHNYGDLINWLFKSHYSVAQVFFEKNTFNDDEAAVFAKALEKSETLRKKGQNHYFCRLWIICSIFMKQKLADETVAEIAYITVDYGQGKKQSEKKYAVTLVDEFKRRIVDKGLLSEFIKLPDAATNDYHKKTLSKFISYMSRTDTSNTAELPRDMPTTKEHESNASAQEADNKTQQSFDLNQFGQQLTEQLDRLISVNDTIASVKLAVADRDREIVQLKQDLKIAQDKIFSAEMEKAQLERRLADSEEKVSELDSRLKQVYETDNAIRDQELQTLKKNVADALKMEYADFKDSDDTVNEDNFMANYASLDRIFRILIRFGFELEG